MATGSWCPGAAERGRDPEAEGASLQARTLARLPPGQGSGPATATATATTSLTRDPVVPDARAAQRQRVARLARALRDERRRGRAGHWSYDLNRHIALLQAYRAARRLLAAMT